MNSCIFIAFDILRFIPICSGWLRLNNQVLCGYCISNNNLIFFCFSFSPFFIPFFHTLLSIFSLFLSSFLFIGWNFIIFYWNCYLLFLSLLFIPVLGCVIFTSWLRWLNNWLLYMNFLWFICRIWLWWNYFWFWRIKIRHDWLLFLCLLYYWWHLLSSNVPLFNVHNIVCYILGSHLNNHINISLLFNRFFFNFSLIDLLFDPLLNSSFLSSSLLLFLALLFGLFSLNFFSLKAFNIFLSLYFSLSKFPSLLLH